MNRVLYREWFPQLLYNHHQSGPAGTILWSPPLRDPFNYNQDPLIALGIAAIGVALHTRLAAEGKPGATSRSGGPYDGWWNGGIRNTAAFHNTIAILTEMIGSPTPMRVPLVMERQLPTSDLTYPVPPQEWHFRRSIDYSVTCNLAVLDLAVEDERELPLQPLRDGQELDRARQHGYVDAAPHRYAAVAAEVAGTAGAAAAGRRRGRARRRRRWRTRRRTRANDAALWAALHRPADRDPRALHHPVVAARFRDGDAVHQRAARDRHHRAPRHARVHGARQDLSGRLVSSCRRRRRSGRTSSTCSSRRIIPTTFRIRARRRRGRTTTPAGRSRSRWASSSIACSTDQRAVREARRLESADAQRRGSDSRRAGVHDQPGGRSMRSPRPTACSRRTKTSTAAPTGAFIVAAKPTTLRGAEAGGDGARRRSSRPRRAARLGPPSFRGRASVSGTVYGGSMDAGWARWILEQFEFPFDRVFAPQLDAGNLNAKYDVLVFVDGAIPARPQPAAAWRWRRCRCGRRRAGAALPNLPAEYPRSGRQRLSGPHLAAAQELRRERRDDRRDRRLGNESSAGTEPAARESSRRKRRAAAEHEVLRAGSVLRAQSRHDASDRGRHEGVHGLLLRQQSRSGSSAPAPRLRRRGRSPGSTRRRRCAAAGPGARVISKDGVIAVEAPVGKGRVYLFGAGNPAARRSRTRRSSSCSTRFLRSDWLTD